MSYTPKKQEKQCPFKFAIPENYQECIKNKCALWLHIQKACSLQVIARGIAIPQRNNQPEL